MADDFWDKKRKEIREKLEKEEDEDSDIPIHEEYTKEEKFKKGEEE